MILVHFLHSISLTVVLMVNWVRGILQRCNLRVTVCCSTSSSLIQVCLRNRSFQLNANLNLHIKLNQLTLQNHLLDGSCTLLIRLNCQNLKNKLSCFCKQIGLCHLVAHMALQSSLLVKKMVDFVCALITVNSMQIRLKTASHCLELMSCCNDLMVLSISLSQTLEMVITRYRQSLVINIKLHLLHVMVLLSGLLCLLGFAMLLLLSNV